MDPITVSVATGVFDIARGLINKLIPDPAANAEAQLKLMEMDQNGQLQSLQLQMSAIIAEANSQDPWTSRARPSFMYLFYAIVTFMVMLAPMLGVFYPEKMDLFFMNVSKGFNAIPEPMWWTFTAGFLGYSGSKSLEAIKGVKRPGQ
jgi:hypothetical protein